MDREKFNALWDQYIEECYEQGGDSVKSPSHYKLEGLEIESIDVIRAVLGGEGFVSFCHGCALKYLIRCKKKGGAEDLQKAQVFLEWMMEEAL